MNMDEDEDWPSIIMAKVGDASIFSPPARD